MKKLILTLTLLFAFMSPVYAQDTMLETATVNVNGLVCDFCARAIEKVFGKQDAVDHINVDLDTKVITITFVEGKTLDDETIKKLITDSGYNVVEINRGA